MISIQESYDYFRSTLSRLDNDKLELDDEKLGYEIFEGLDSEYHSFLHESTVDRLINEKRIPKSTRQPLLKLRDSLYIVMESKHSITEYRNDPQWKELRMLANEISNEIKMFAEN